MFGNLGNIFGGPVNPGDGGVGAAPRPQLPGGMMGGFMGMPSSGLGPVSGQFGAPNASSAPPPSFMGGMQPSGMLPPAAGNMYAAQQAAQNAPQQGWATAGQGMPTGGTGGLAGVISQLHPQTTQALQNIPPQALQQLHSAGLIHPGLMQHLSGQG
jgi:hypothetical protein